MPNENHHSVSIRLATTADAAALAALTRELMQYERELAQETSTVNPWAATEDELRKQISLPNTNFFVAESETKIVGFLRAVVVGLELSREEIGVVGWLEAKLEKLAKWIFTKILRRPRPAVKVESGYIAGAYVQPGFRRCGIGRALATATEQWFQQQGLQHSELHVLFTNEAARAMWEELGYEPLALGMRKKI